MVDAVNNQQSGVLIRLGLRLSSGEQRRSLDALHLSQAGSGLCLGELTQRFGIRQVPCWHANSRAWEDVSRG